MQRKQDGLVPKLGWGFPTFRADMSTIESLATMAPVWSQRARQRLGERPAAPIAHSMVAGAHRPSCSRLCLIGTGIALVSGDGERVHGHLSFSPH